jgi:phosphomannomutase
MVVGKMDTLRSRLTYKPRELQFGTSGRRGEIAHLTPLEIYVNVTAELEYLRSIGLERGDFYVALDLRQSSPRICQTVLRAACDAGMRAVNLGRIPTPALANYAWARGRASIMVTGSHIPFDRNGYKLNTPAGELLKSHEAPIGELVARVRSRLYEDPFADSPFDERGDFKVPPADLPPADDAARTEYLGRYRAFFGKRSLAGIRILLYEHSAVGRDLLAELLSSLGAEVVRGGRSDEFVPIDTENIDAAQLAIIQHLADGAGEIDAVVSTDGDSDRPLVLGVDRASRRVRFFGGDLLGMVVAEFLGADSVVVPISCNDAIDRGVLAGMVEPKTRIGSPYVIAGMEAARGKGRRAVCGWEANGGFLTGSDIVCGGETLRALPTRDAFLPVLSVLLAAKEKGVALGELFDRLPRRFSRAALLKRFPREVSLRIVRELSTARRLAPFFPGFGAITSIDYTDGVRITFSNGDIAHVRPSGNADELRIYAVADTRERADEIAAMGVAEPDGILRRMERGVGSTIG